MGSLNISCIFTLLLASASVCGGQDVRANTTDGCSLVMDGEVYQALKLTTPGSSSILVEGDGCRVTFLVVGGGGRGSGYGGSGSGFIQYRSIDFYSGSVTALVGNQAQASTVILEQGKVVTAMPGEQSVTSWWAGDGYSGGGGFGCGTGSGGVAGSGGRGGADGGQGLCGYSGIGTGQDVSSFAFTAWTLSAGWGGMGYGGYGGGGGGVLVNGECECENTYGYAGSGYGGGSSGQPQPGLHEACPGLVLIEVAAV